MRKIKILYILLISIDQEISLECASSVGLSKLGFTLNTTETQITYCSTHYQNAGQCISNSEFLSWTEKYKSFLIQKAKDAQQMSLLTNYLAQWNYIVGQISSSNQTLGFRTPDHLLSDSLSGGTIWAEVGDTFTSLVNQISGYIKDLRNNVTQSINVCLQRYYQLGIGTVCLLTSKSQSSISSNNVDLKFQQTVMKIEIGIEDTGTQLLDNCLSIMDIFCNVNYGISLAKNTTEFNRTWDSVNTQMSRQTCLDLRTVYNCTTSDCQKYKKIKIISKLLSTNIIPYIPDKILLDSMGLTMNGTVALGSFQKTYKNWFDNYQAPFPGIEFEPSDTGKNVYTIGSDAGLTVPTFSFDCILEITLGLFASLLLLF